MASQKSNAKQVVAKIIARHARLDGKTCPVCGKEAVLKFYEEKAKVWKFKHTRLVRTASGHKVTETTYHEAA